jgi:hypothetical protein
MIRGVVFHHKDARKYLGHLEDMGKICDGQLVFWLADPKLGKTFENSR